MKQSVSLFSVDEWPVSQMEGKPRALHVGCIFNRGMALDARMRHCVHADADEITTCTFGDEHVFDPVMCLFSDHTTHQTAEVTYVFPCRIAINRRSYLGTYFSGPPSQRYSQRKLERLSKPVQQPSYSNAFDIHDAHSTFMARYALTTYATSQLRILLDAETPDALDFEAAGKAHAAYLYLCALRMTCKAFAFDNTITQWCTKWQMATRSMRNNTCQALAIGCRQTPAKLCYSVFFSGHVTDLRQVVRAMLTLPSNRRAVLMVANYHRTPMLRAHCVSINFAGGTHRAMARLKAIARVMELCGHGYNGKQYALVRAVTEATNKYIKGGVHARLDLLLTHYLPKLYSQCVPVRFTN